MERCGGGQAAAQPQRSRKGTAGAAGAAVATFATSHGVAACPVLVHVMTP